MKNKQNKKRSPVRIILLVLLAAAIVSGSIFSYFGGFGTGGCADTEEFAKYAGTISDISVPEEARVIALGEATHGNTEFQQLKLDVFKVMVEKYGVRAFALEGDFGCCEAVDRYINGGEGSARGAAEDIGFAIYRTEPMEQLIEWMRGYNETAAEGDKLRFYGFDMQRTEYNHRYLLEAAKCLGADVSELEKTWDSEKDDFSDGFDAGRRAVIYEDIKKELSAIGSPEAEKAVHLADTLLQNCELGKLIYDPAEGNALRDRYMADNIMWILGQEETLGNKRVFVSAHNLHIKKFYSYGAAGKATGNILADELGGEYFAIGTDFYRSRCNLPKGGEGDRKNHTFYSYDPLAKASMKCGYDISWLDFSTVPENSALRQHIDSYTWMGSLGEAYSPLMAVMPMEYRGWVSPAKLYDGVIFVAYAHPTEIREPAKKY